MRDRLILLLLSGLAVFPVFSMNAADTAWGPMHHEFELTLDNGRGTESLGPLFGVERADSRTTRRWTPLISRVDDPVGDFSEVDVAYPLLTYDRFGDEYRFQIMQVFAFAGGRGTSDEEARRFTLFPFYFQQRSPDTNENYTAVLPFYGRLKNRLFRHDVKWVMLPLYLQTRKRDVVTDNYLVPFFHLRHGNNLKGWQFWPAMGYETKEPATVTNVWDEATLDPGHRKFFALWPFYFNVWTGLGSENPMHQHNILPVLALERSPLRDSTTVMWPFFTRVDDREKKYREWGLPWPLVIFARGEGKTANRVWPLYSRVYNDTQESRFLLWPLYKRNTIQSDPLDRRFSRVLFFLYQDLRQRDTVTEETMWRKDLWPLFTARRDWDGSTRRQFLAPLEPLLRSSESVERNYSPLWSIWRIEKNPRAGRSSQSLLWNLWRRDVSENSRKCSIFFGLVQYQSDPDGSRWKWFHLGSGRDAETTEKTATPEAYAAVKAGSESPPAEPRRKRGLPGDGITGALGRLGDLFSRESSREKNDD